jgi:CheY-like chemotaxis protein
MINLFELHIFTIKTIFLLASLPSILPIMRTSKSNARILIVDDELPMRRLNECSLRRGGFDSFYFGENGHEAVKLASEVRPDLIIIDYVMPELDGLSALDQLKAKAETARIPVIMVSGCNDFHESRGRAAAASAVLKKPCNPTLLLETAERALAA